MGVEVGGLLSLHRFLYKKYLQYTSPYKHINHYKPTSLSSLVWFKKRDDHEWVSTMELNHQPPKDASQAMLRHPKRKIPCPQTAGIDIFFVKQKGGFQKPRIQKKAIFPSLVVEFTFFVGEGL